VPSWKTDLGGRGQFKVANLSVLETNLIAGIRMPEYDMHYKCSNVDIQITRVARFFFTLYTKTGKNIPNDDNITKWP
jgi:hypothetical protein